MKGHTFEDYGNGLVRYCVTSLYLSWALTSLMKIVMSCAMDYIIVGSFIIFYCNISVTFHHNHNYFSEHLKMLGIDFFLASI